MQMLCFLMGPLKTSAEAPDHFWEDVFFKAPALCRLGCILGYLCCCASIVAVIREYIINQLTNCQFFDIVQSFPDMMHYEYVKL